MVSCSPVRALGLGIPHVCLLWMLVVSVVTLVVFQALGFVLISCGSFPLVPKSQLLAEGCWSSAAEQLLMKTSGCALSVSTS